MRKYVSPKRRRRTNLHQITNPVQEFNAFSRERHTGAGQVTKAAQQLNGMSQHNPSLSEQTAVTADGSNGHHNLSGQTPNRVSHTMQEDLWEQGRVSASSSLNFG